MHDISNKKNKFSAIFIAINVSQLSSLRRIALLISVVHIYDSKIIISGVCI